MSDVTTQMDIHVFDDPDFGWVVGYEQSVGGGCGVRIAYRETGRDPEECPSLDIVASPEVLRVIASAIVRIADEQEKG